MKVLNFSIAITLLIVVFAQSAVFASNPESEIKSRWDAFIEFWEAKDAKACAGFYLEDGVNIPQALTEKNGRAEIEAFYDFLFSMYKSSTYAHTTHTLHTSGNMAIEYGSFVVNWITQNDELFIYKANCMVHWEKAADGVWYIRTLLFNNPPAEE